MVKKKTDERRPCIYCARNKITNKYYVGQTRYGLKHRQHQHLDRAYNKKRNTRFCRALRIYGQDSFVWETLYIVRNDDLNPEQLQSLLNMREKAWVKYFNSFRKGYNQDEGGTGGVRYKYATLEEKKQAKNRSQKIRRDNNRETYNAAMKARREAKGEAYREQRRKYIHQKFEDHPEIKEQYNAAMKARREADPNFKQQRKEYRKQKEEANPELREERNKRHREYMKENQQKRRSLRRDKMNARQNAKRAENREAYRIAFKERRRKRKENKLNNSLDPISQYECEGAVCKIQADKPSRNPYLQAPLNLE